jgi:hypothetical protein
MSPVGHNPLVGLTGGQPLSNHSLSRYDGLKTEQKSLYYVFLSEFMLSLWTVPMIELIVFRVIIKYRPLIGIAEMKRAPP